MTLEKPTRIGNPMALYESQVSLMIAKRALPEVVAFLVTKRGVVQAEHDLRDIARIITDRMLICWKPKTLKPFQIVKEMMNTFFNNKKLKGKITKRIDGKPAQILIRDYNCPICPDKKGEEIKVTELPYCIPIAGFIQAVIQHLIDKDLVPYTKVSCETLKSVGSGDNYCEHVINLEYGGY
ncbi:MAG: hypothetical protein ACTSRS_17025 [Candidatus Helarchaeota archaeon]